MDRNHVAAYTSIALYYISLISGLEIYDRPTKTQMTIGDHLVGWATSRQGGKHHVRHHVIYMVADTEVDMVVDMVVDLVIISF